MSIRIPSKHSLVKQYLELKIFKSCSCVHLNKLNPEGSRRSDSAMAKASVYSFCARRQQRDTDNTRSYWSAAYITYLPSTTDLSQVGAIMSAQQVSAYKCDKPALVQRLHSRHRSIVLETNQWRAAAPEMI